MVCLISKKSKADPAAVTGCISTHKHQAGTDTKVQYVKPTTAKTTPIGGILHQKLHSPLDFETYPEVLTHGPPPTMVANDGYLLKIHPLSRCFTGFHGWSTGSHVAWTVCWFP